MMLKEGMQGRSNGEVDVEEVQVRNAIFVGVCNRMLVAGS